MFISRYNLDFGSLLDHHCSVYQIEDVSWVVAARWCAHQVTPGGAMEILAILGKEESLRRLEIGLEKLKK